MKRMALLLALTFTVGLLVGTIANQALNAQPAPLKITTPFKADIVGMEGKEVIVQVGEFAPSGASGKHSHPGHEILFVLDGALIREAEGHAASDLKAGEAMYQPPMQVANTKNASTTHPLKIVVFRIHPKDQPITHRVTEPHFWR